MATKRNRGWIWYFLIVAGLTVAAVATLILFGRGRLLRPEDLKTARKLWEAKGPRDYQLTYTVKKGTDPPEEYEVRVRGGKVVAAFRNGRPLEKRIWEDYGMEGKFLDIERFLEMDAKPGRPGVYAHADFASDNGALKYYVRRVMGGKERVEITVESLQKLED